MRKEYPINGLEQDVIYGRSRYCFLKNNNKIIKWVKRHMNKRFRQKEKEKIKKEFYENN